VFNRLVDGFPAKELKLIDMTLKMFTIPRLMLDTEMLRQAIDEEERKRGEILGRLGVDDGALASNDRFADLLRRMDVEPPTKLSKTTGRRTYAFAKNDALFQALLNSEREDVALLCEARLKVKSTLERTRAQRFLDIASRGALPVPLNYYGAHTGRWSASRGSGLNLQNLKRGSFLRRSILAPEGHSLVVCDLSQIEPRVLAWVSGYDALLDIFRSGQDAYAAFGAQMFNIPNLSKESHPDLRQSAKSALLGAGYGMGWASFSAQLLTGFLGAPPMMYDKKFAKQVGVSAVAARAFLKDKVLMKQFEKIPHTCTEEELFYHCLAAKAIIEIYRRAAQPVTDFWALCQSAINHCLLEGNEYKHKCITFRKEEILLPNGMKLRYPDIKVSKEKGVVYGPDETKLYGGKLTENIVQALARIVMTDGMLRTQKRYSVCLTVHDEEVVIVPDAYVQEAEQWVLEQMTMEPKYMPGIPLAAEVSSAKRYGDAK
jgi:DNA polymerase